MPGQNIMDDSPAAQEGLVHFTVPTHTSVGWGGPAGGLAAWAGILRRRRLALLWLSCK